MVLFCAVGMKGNKLIRGGDPDKSRKQRKRDKTEKMRKSKRGQRLQRKMNQVKERRDKRQTNGHTAVLMESFVVRRKAVRKAARKVEKVRGDSTEPRSERSDSSKPVRRAAASSRALY